MPQLLRSICFLALFLFVGAGASSAATFASSISCPQVTVGPVTLLANNYSAGSVTLTPGVPLTSVALLPTNQLTRIDNNAATPGTYTGTLACTLTFGGVNMDFARSLSLKTVLGPPILPGDNIMTTGAVSFTVDLGCQGKVDISAPTELTLGYTGGVLVVVPLGASDTLLLHDVPDTCESIPTLSEWAQLAMVALLIAGGLLTLRHRRLNSRSLST